jgi:hypothetical protein
MGKMKEMYTGIMEQVDSVVNNCSNKKDALEFIKKTFGEQWAEYAEDMITVKENKKRDINV